VNHSQLGNFVVTSKANGKIEFIFDDQNGVRPRKARNWIDGFPLFFDNASSRADSQNHRLRTSARCIGPGSFTLDAGSPASELY
jgi:hypothetical protein